MSFFSGGVDSTYTFLKRRPEISHLVYIQGFDYFAGVGDGTAFGIDDIADLAQIAYKLDTSLRTRFPHSSRRGFRGRHRRPCRSIANPAPAPANWRRTWSGIFAGSSRGPSIYPGTAFCGSLDCGLRRGGFSAQGADREGFAEAESAPARRMPYPLEIARRDGSIFGAAVARNGSFARRERPVPDPRGHELLPFRLPLQPEQEPQPRQRPGQRGPAPGIPSCFRSVLVLLWPALSARLASFDRPLMGDRGDRDHPRRIRGPATGQGPEDHRRRAGAGQPQGLFQ